MTVRHVTIAAFAMSLSACAWLSPPHRQPARPATPAPSAPQGLPSPAASISADIPPSTNIAKAHRHPAKKRRPRLAARAGTAQALAHRNELRGTLRLAAGRGQQLHPGEAVDTVVYFVPASGAPSPRPRRNEIVTAHRDFQPSAIAVPLGSTISYVNQDTVRHNVFSVTPGAAFDLGYQPAGSRDTHVFGKAGLVLVNCNVHHTMEMDVLVVPSRYATRVAADGSFALRGLPPGPGELVAWNPRARMLRRPLSLPAAQPVALQLLAERPRVVTRIDVGTAP